MKFLASWVKECYPTGSINQRGNTWPVEHPRASASWQLGSKNTTPGVVDWTRASGRMEGTVCVCVRGCWPTGSIITEFHIYFVLGRTGGRSIGHSMDGRAGWTEPGLWRRSVPILFWNRSEVCSYGVKASFMWSWEMTKPCRPMYLQYVSVWKYRLSFWLIRLRIPVKESLTILLYKLSPKFIQHFLEAEYFCVNIIS